MVRNGLHVTSGYKGGEENEEGLANFESKREKVGSSGKKERARFDICKREEKERREEEKRRIEKRKKEGSSFVETVDLFLWVFYPLVISEVVYCSHDSDFSSEMKYILP